MIELVYNIFFVFGLPVLAILSLRYRPGARLAFGFGDIASGLKQFGEGIAKTGEGAATGAAAGFIAGGPMGALIGAGAGGVTGAVGAGLGLDYGDIAKYSAITGGGVGGIGALPVGGAAQAQGLIPTLFHGAGFGAKWGLPGMSLGSGLGGFGAPSFGRFGGDSLNLRNLPSLSGLDQEQTRQLANASVAATEKSLNIQEKAVNIQEKAVEKERETASQAIEKKRETEKQALEVEQERIKTELEKSKNAVEQAKQLVEAARTQQTNFRPAPLPEPKPKPNIALYWALGGAALIVGAITFAKGKR